VTRHRWPTPARRGVRRAGSPYAESRRYASTASTRRYQIGLGTQSTPMAATSPSERQTRVRNGGVPAASRIAPVNHDVGDLSERRARRTCARVATASGAREEQAPSGTRSRRSSVATVIDGGTALPLMPQRSNRAVRRARIVPPAARSALSKCGRGAKWSAVAISDVATGDPVLAWAAPVTTVGRRALRFAAPGRPPADARCAGGCDRCHRARSPGPRRTLPRAVCA
jgi:hypothetical protein